MLKSAAVAATMLLASAAATDTADHNRELLRPAAGTKPHIIMHLADDFGWANAGWHRPEGYEEVQTPNMDALVKQGIELDHAYSYKFCSPTRSCLQSGRLPVHVNVLNLAPDAYNPADPVSGFAAIPRNMTGMAAKMKLGGYKTHQVGKWDAGMATRDHTPHGRGYDTAFGYFHHANDYWNEKVGAFVDLYNETADTTWAGGGGASQPTNGPGYGYNGSCPSGGDWPPQGKCGMTGPEEEYEEFKFKTRVLQIINQHAAAEAQAPLFLCYTSHIVHEPLQVPNRTWNHFDFIQKSAVGDYQYHRQTYHSMVYYMDEVVGSMVAALHAKDMWANTLWVHQSDNGGPSFTGSDHTANNYPQRGSKMTNWQGGIRVNAFVSGGFLQTSAPAMVGTKLDGFTHAADWYATFASLAGVSKVDERAALAKLPPVDGLDLWPYLSGATKASPRTEVFADSQPFGVLLMEVDGKKWKLFETSPPDADGLVVVDEVTGERGPQHAARGNPRTSCPQGKVCVPDACMMGPQYPNGSDPSCNTTVVLPAEGLLFDLTMDPGEYTSVAAENPDELAKLKARLAQLQPTFFNPSRSDPETKNMATYAAEARGGFWGPFVFP